MWSKYIPHTSVGYRMVGGRSWDECVELGGCYASNVDNSR